jgi:response regulator RpfG family c-di-GMP phosphodiesterase
MGSEVAGEIDRAQVRLAELVAALSLGIDLGFGQPMEHVLRQCLIALRLADGIGLGEEQRAVVYYSALLINVGCHSDAHEQAKWFGDDIAVKSIKYDHEPRSLRMAATGMRFLGHGQAVSDLAAEAGARLGLAEADVRLLRRAGLVHGLGRLGVSNAILDKRGPLGAGEWERVRLQPYLTDRMLRQAEALAPVAWIAVQHRERLDGSGYPRGLSGAGICREARILAAADAYQAMREPVPIAGSALPRRPRASCEPTSRRPPRRRAKSRSSGCSPADSRTRRSPNGS